MKKQTKTIKQIDRERFLAKLRDRVLAEKSIEITLRNDGVTLADVRIAMGGKIVCVPQENGTVKISVRETQS